MAHQIEVNDTMFSANGIVPWHGLGRIIHGVPSIKEGIVAAGLDWEVTLKDLCLKESGLDVDHKATVRVDTGDVLGVVGPRYHPLQNAEAFAVFEPMVDAGLITLETAGSLQGNRRIWILARVANDAARQTVVRDDRVEMFILLSHSHDGTLAIRFGLTPIRVVCANTLAMAHDASTSKLIKVLHTKSAVQNLENLRDCLNLAVGEFQATIEQYRNLANKGINQADLRKYIKVVFGIKDEQEKNSSYFDKIIPLFERGRGNDLKGSYGTAWTAYNAVNEFLVWEKGRTPEGRLNSVWFGPDAAINKSALETALEIFLKAA